MLLAVDSDSVVGVLEALLVARGFAVVRERSGAKALERAAEAPPDVFVVALELAGPLDGVELCRRLRARNDTRATPILLLASSADDDLRTLARDAGCTGFYTLPVSPSALLKEIESARPRESRPPKP